jgi:hypothetical protein
MSWSWGEYKRPNISLSELYDMRKRKETNRMKSFDQIMELCHRRIRNIASYGGMNCFYEIPGVLVGFPLYNLEECIQYVVEKLRGTGFLVQLLPPPQIGIVYISWDPQEIKPKRPALMGPSIGKASSQSQSQSRKNNRREPLLIDTDNGNHRTRGDVKETKMIMGDFKPKVTNPLKDRFRIF